MESFFGRKHDVVGLDVQVNNSIVVHETQSLKNLAADDLAFVLIQFKGSVSNGAEEIAALQMLSYNASLVDSFIIMEHFDNKLALR